ncbi:hypothetical protein HAX54_028275 [Datura stramonium]|uniref:Uncharacterized protein n=1 Tax=Datura stramonium TaxID=4076 RepID=A0ABS8S9H9_DATST|nr:hypothetical protein [Datura stramonium]
MKIPEEPKIQTGALMKCSKLIQLFKKYNMRWMAETLRKYSGEMVREFYTNYYSTLENKAPKRQAVKKEPVLDMVPIKACSVDISDRTISQFLFGSVYKALVLTTESDMRRMAKRLTITVRKINMFLEKVKPWAKKELEKIMRGMNIRLDWFETSVVSVLDDDLDEDIPQYFDLDTTLARKHTFNDHMKKLHEKVKGAGSSVASVVLSRDVDDPSGKPQSISAIVPAIGGGTLVTPMSTTLLSTSALADSVASKTPTIVDFGVTSATPTNQSISI